MFNTPHHPIRIPMEDPLIRTADRPFCEDPTCPDKEDPESLAEVAQLVEDSLLTPDEATNYALGKTL